MNVWTHAAAADRQYWRALLILGRTSNLPTVWSNCLAGWLLGGGERIAHLFWLLAGGSLLYIGGMFLNDAFDEDFDRQHRSERPIPSGRVAVKEVWFYGVSWIVLGLFCVVWISSTTALLAMGLVSTILIYDAIHKMVAVAPVLMAFCRLLLFLMAASGGAEGVTGLAVWSSLVLAAYIIGLSYLARKESARGPLQKWPAVLLVFPVGLAFFVDDAEYRGHFYVLSLILVLWLARCLRYSVFGLIPNIGRSVSGLLAGIVLVDLLAVGSQTFILSFVFFLLFAAALSFQRYIPAT